MEITYKITEQEMIEILSKELENPVGSVIQDTDGNFIAKTTQEKKVPVENNSEMDAVREDFTEKFGLEKTESILSFFDEFFDGLKEQGIKDGWRGGFSAEGKSLSDPKPPSEQFESNEKCPDRPDNIFFYKEEGNERTIWMIDNRGGLHGSKNGTLWCRWGGFWSIFENQIGLNYSDIQYITKTMMEKHLNREVGKPEP